MGEQLGKDRSDIRLTTKRRAWLAEYLNIWDATEAARRVGYKWPNKQGPALLQILRPMIAEEIERRQMTADEALTRLAERATFDVSPYLVVSDDGRVTVDLDRLIEDGHGRHVKGVVHTRYGDRVVFHDSQDALFLLAKLLGLESAAEAKSIEIFVRSDPDYGSKKS